MKMKIVPELRFPGFDEKWRETPLGKLADLYQPKTISQTDLTAEGYTVYGANGVIGKYHSFNHEMPQIAVTCRGSTCGLVNFTEPHSWITGNAMVVNLDERPNETKRFVYHALNATDLRYLITGSGQPQITGNLKGHEIGVPSLLEQRKIAEFLTAVDGRIGQLGQKKALLEDYKKGVMQQLFTQALRFKDDHGKDFPEWEEKTLGDVSQNVMYGMNAAAKEFDGETKYIRITDIDPSSNRFRPDPVTSPDQPAEDRYKLRRGDIVFARTGASVGKSYLYDESDGNLAFAGFLIRFSICGEMADPYFVFLQTLSESYWKWVKANSMRSGQPGINAEEYKTFAFQLPSLPEQTKIANFLTALDRKIESVAQQIRHTQAFKKGLLQQMFV